MSATRASFASRSKMPRGRPDPFGQVSDGGGFHLVPGLQILEQDRAQLDEPQRRLASGDDGVHAGTVRVVRADPAVAITVQGRGVAAGPAVTLTGYEVDERFFLGLLHGLPSLSLGRANRDRCGRGSGPWGGPISAGFGTVYRAKPSAPRGKSVPPVLERLRQRRYSPAPAPARKYRASAPSSWTVASIRRVASCSSGLVGVGEPQAWIPSSWAIRSTRSMCGRSETKTASARPWSRRSAATE